MADSQLDAILSRFACMDLVHTYARLIRSDQPEGISALFTEDGVFASPNSTTVGRGAIVENFKVKHAPFPVTWHDPHGVAVEFDDDDNARGTVIGYAELAWPDRTVITSIRYHDDFRREDGRWRFASRHVLSVYGMTAQDWLDGGMGRDERKRWPGRPVAAAEQIGRAHV